MSELHHLRETAERLHETTCEYEASLREKLLNDVGNYVDPRSYPYQGNGLGSNYRDETSAHVGVQISYPQRYNHDQYGIGRSVPMSWFNRCVGLVAAELKLELYMDNYYKRALFCWTTPIHYKRMLIFIGATGHTPLVKFLQKDGDHAIQWRILNFLF